MVKKRDVLNMGSILGVFFGLFMMGSASAATPTSCGPGYVLAAHSNIDGIKAAECVKLWCRDLETGASMGGTKNAASGYQNTSAPVELCDANNNCIECFGERKWCNGEPRGEWNPEYGAYTRGGDNASFESYLRGGCFAWRLEKPECEDGMVAVLKNDEWVCATISSSGAAASINKASSVRRTGTTIRRVLR